MYFSCGDTHSVFVFRAGRRAEVWAGRGREAHAACPGLCGDAGVPALNGGNVLAPAQCTPNRLPLDSPQTAWFCGNNLLREKKTDCSETNCKVRGACVCLCQQRTLHAESRVRSPLEL